MASNLGFSSGRLRPKGKASREGHSFLGPSQPDEKKKKLTINKIRKLHFKELRGGKIKFVLRGKRGAFTRLNVDSKKAATHRETGDSTVFDEYSQGSFIGEPDALLSRLRAKGAQASDALLTDPAYLSGEAFAARIGLTRQALDKRRRAGGVLGLQGEKRGVRYPVWQLEERDGQPARILPALKETLPDLLDILGGPWSVHTFLTTDWPQIGGRTGLDLLREGAGAEVLELARSTRYGGGT